jgi:acetyl esterase
MRQRWVAWFLLVLTVVGAAAYGGLKLSPWPSVLLIRYAFAKDTANRTRALEKHQPADVAELRDQRYSMDEDTRLDVFFPAKSARSRQALPTIVWIHGGAFVYGSKSDVAGYLRMIAARGYTTVGIDYSIAPSGKYPTPVKQANQALAFLIRNADLFHVDATKLFLAGDSAGAQIAAQLAAIISDPGYAASVGISPSIPRKQLRGIALLCGVYDPSAIKLEGEFGGFIRTVLWSYFGSKDLTDDPRLAEFAVNRHLTPAFPPVFISVGNADPLAPQSALMAASVRNQGVAVESLLFPADHDPPLTHEYQFNLDDAAALEALKRLTAFFDRLSK